MKPPAQASRTVRSAPGIRAVTFDVGGTLIEPKPSVGHVYAEMAAAHGYPDIPVTALNQRFARAWQQFTDFHHAREQWAALVDATFGPLVREPPSQTFFPALYQRFTEPNTWHVFDDVIPTLQKLRARGLKLGVISNWDERLRPLLRNLNLDHFFQAIIVSCEAGSCKPSHAIFHAAARALELPPESILHVGDSLESDVHGARDAGFKPLLIRRGRKRVGHGEIRSLRELT